MAWLISGLGAVLALVGAYSLWNGISYIRLDWGQTQTVAGTVAFCSGVVTLALGAILFALRDLVARTEQRPSGVGLEALTWGEEDAPVSRPMMGRVRDRLATVGLPKAPEAAARPEPMPPAVAAVPVEDTMPVHRPPSAARVEPAAEPVAAAPRVQPAPPQAPAPVEAPTVVGRYEANGASYVLFSDGTIEVETESGTHRFASMADLKEHIERQDAGLAAG
jgi:hypothetical protein